MADITFIDKEFPAVENPGIDTLDQRFQDIVASAENVDFTGLSSLAEELFNENIFDMRVIGYYLQAIFVEHGLKSLDNIFSCLEGIFRQNWETVGPAKKKEKHTQRALSWFFEQLLSSLQYHLEQNDSSAQQWIRETTPQDIQNLLELIEKFQQEMLNKFEAPDVIEFVGKIRKWLQDFSITITPSEPTETSQEEKNEENKPTQHNQSFAENNHFGTGIHIEVAYPLQMLIKKIEAFGVLVEKNDFERAAIIADDINNNIIANFDPRVYFPKTFAQYYKQLSTSINSIAQHWENKETLPWQMMAEFYKVDLDGFMQG